MPKWDFGLEVHRSELGERADSSLHQWVDGPHAEPNQHGKGMGMLSYWWEFLNFFQI